MAHQGIGEARRLRFRSFRTKLILLLAVTVSVPLVLACLILGLQLDRQARTLFAQGLNANLETFSLILQENQRNLYEGLTRAATDNTLQITLDLEIKAQLTKYIDTQRQVLRIAFLGVYDRDNKLVGFSGSSETSETRWRLIETGKYGNDCIVTRQVDRQFVRCGEAMYLVSVVPIIRPQESNLGDAGSRGQAGALLGYLMGGTPLADPALIASLLDKQIAHPLIWVDENLVFANVPARDLTLPEATYGQVKEFNIEDTPYLGSIRSSAVGTQRMTYGVLAPLAPLRTALFQSVVTVGGIGALLIAVTLLAGGFIANRMLRPIRQLREGAVRIGGGDLSQRISVKTGDELEALANQFNDMASKLEESYSGLEQKVKQRTAELSRSLNELRTAQDRLVQTEKLASLGQLTAGIAHEIKNPLNFVNNFSSVSVELVDELSDALRKVKLEPQPQAEITETAAMLRGNLEKIVQHGKRADSIVKNMLLHSRSGSGDHRAVDINAIVEESLNLAYHGARAEKQGFNITLEKELDPAAGQVDLFPQEITRVFLNLISNGFYAASKRKADGGGGAYEPLLRATTKNLGESVEIRIRDNGTGILPEVKEKMFHPFFTTKPAGEGTGLGLSISHDIVVKQHAGSIEVASEPGQFTEFRIVLPRAAASLGASGGKA